MDELVTTGLTVTQVVAPPEVKEYPTSYPPSGAVPLVDGALNVNPIAPAAALAVVIAGADGVGTATGVGSVKVLTTKPCPLLTEFGSASYAMTMQVPAMAWEIAPVFGFTVQLEVPGLYRAYKTPLGRLVTA